MTLQGLIKSIKVLRPWQSDSLLFSPGKVKNDNKMQTSTEENSCASDGFRKHIRYQFKKKYLPPSPMLCQVITSSTEPHPQPLLIVFVSLFKTFIPSVLKVMRVCSCNMPFWHWNLVLSRLTFYTFCFKSKMYIFTCNMFLIKATFLFWVFPFLLSHKFYFLQSPKLALFNIFSTLSSPSFPRFSLSHHRKG